MRRSDLADFTYDELNRYKEAGLLEKVSERSGIDYASIKAWTDGKTNPTTASMEKVLDAMGYKVVVRKKDPNKEWW